MKNLTMGNALFVLLVLAHLPAQATLAWTPERLAQALQRQDYAHAQAPLQALLQEAQPDAQHRALVYEWLYASDDKAELDRRTQEVLQWPDAQVDAVDLQAAGRLALERMQYARAQACFARALQRASTPAAQAAAWRGLGQLAYKKLDFDGSLTLLQKSVALDASADNQSALAATLIRLGRTDEAIDAVEQAVLRNPLHEEAHYYLGNGYARRNYSELELAYGAKLQASAVLVHQGSEAFGRGNFVAAQQFAQAALQQCPENGRAHNLLAKALQFQRFQIDVHRADYERRFAAVPMPVVPGIAQYVLNWNTLTPRQQKRVALSVAPWKAFLPVLIAGGAHHYIKPLYMKLSDVPGMQALKNQRINTDARLWDDVRGAGGFTTVTGVEDVEKTVFDSYNTVLHELTHQVHGVLTADQAREIQDAYRRAKAREDSSHNAFLSRYASGTVWEYFAEGVNALASPQRDTYDTREIVRERLSQIDPQLQALVERRLAQTDVRASLSIAFMNAGNDQLERGKLGPALAHFSHAASLAPDDESVRAAQLYALSLQGQAQRTGRAATDAAQRFARSGTVQTIVADALWHSGTDLASVTTQLASARAQVDPVDTHLVDQKLGDYYWRLGDVARALQSYDQVLAYQSDNPEAQWGRAAALALAQQWDPAFALYEQAVRARTGVVELRNDLVRDLLRAGRLEAAQAQLQAARLIEPGHPVTEALAAWLRLQQSDARGAAQQAQAVLQAAPWCDLARLVLAQALLAQARKAEAAQALAPLQERLVHARPPHYVYRNASASWLSVEELPALERQWLAELLSLLVRDGAPPMVARGLPRTPPI